MNPWIFPLLFFFMTSEFLEWALKWCQIVCKNSPPPPSWENINPFFGVYRAPDFDVSFLALKTAFKVAAWLMLKVLLKQPWFLDLENEIGIAEKGLKKGEKEVSQKKKKNIFWTGQILKKGILCPLQFFPMFLEVPWWLDRLVEQRRTGGSSLLSRERKNCRCLMIQCWPLQNWKKL